MRKRTAALAADLTLLPLSSALPQTASSGFAGIEALLVEEGPSLHPRRPRRSAAEKLKTMIRHPAEKAKR